MQNQKAPKLTKTEKFSLYSALIWFWTCILAIEIETHSCTIIITITVCSDLPIRPPLTSEQMPTSWWIPNCCDKSLLVGTYKHGCENYQEIRSDSTLCFITHIGPPSTTVPTTTSSCPATTAVAAAAVEEAATALVVEDDASGAVAQKAATATTPAPK